MKKLIASIAVGVLALSLAACSPEASAGSGSKGAPGPEALEDADGVTTITLWHGFGNANGEALDASISAFNAANAGKIHVNSSFQGSYTDLLAKYTAGLRDDSTPTVVISGDTTSGYLRDVQRSVSPEAMAEANPDDLDLSQIRPVGANYYGADGEMFAVPLAISTPVLWVNTDLLTQAGIDPKTDLKTIQDVAAAAKRVKAKTGVSGLAGSFDGWWFEQITAASGNSYCAPKNGRSGDGATSLPLDAPAQVDGLRSLVDVYTSGAGTDIGVDGNAAVTAFAAGQVAMMFNSSGAAGALDTSAPSFDFEAVPYPLSEGADPTEAGPVIGGAAMWLSSTATDAEKVAGWKLISYLASAENQESFSAATGYVPVNKGVDDLPARRKYLASHPDAQTFVDQIDNTPSVTATAGCLSGAMTSIRAAVSAQMEAAINGSVTLDEALANARTEADKAIEQYRTQLG